jgi:hypothetical protein
MSRRIASLGGSLGVAIFAATASAQPASPASPGPTVVAAAAVEPEPASEDFERDTKADELAARLAELEARLAEQNRKPQFPVKLTGYGDLGLFATQGDGTGFRRDIGHKMFPEYSEFGWVFYGDLLGTQVNSRGDVADLGQAPGVDRFDSVNSEGNLTFLVNELNLTINAGLGDRALFTSSVNFTPRTGTEFQLGDSFDVDIVQLEWMPTKDGKTSIFVGKFDSVLGIEYKGRKASQRFGITPSLIARYTTGTAIGLKARTRLINDHLVLSAAVTNGSFGTEQFHFFQETDSNNFKTLSGRAALRFPIGSGALELGPSGQWGTEDGTLDGAGAMWFAGVDVELNMPRFDIKAQWLKGKAPGDEFTMTYALDLKQGGYLETNVVVTPTLGLLARAEFRDAEVQQGLARLYITKSWRATAGLRLILNPHATIKAEYSHNGEYGGSPSIPNDVVTTSAVMAF